MVKIDDLESIVISMVVAVPRSFMLNENQPYREEKPEELNWLEVAEILLTERKEVLSSSVKSKDVIEPQPSKSKKKFQQFLEKVKFLRRFISNLASLMKVFVPLLRLKSTKPFVWEDQHQEAFDVLKAYLVKPPVMILPDWTKPLKLYISTTDDALGCFQAQDYKEAQEKAVYYLSRILSPANSDTSPWKNCA
ncbi:hypothetical protein ACH5RR_018679 [Cinchona calisaya]|uniref:Reverse transcriptase/retrotransposon-derived protein RNase H-like domain-containing protein n=1 Tax=Cinchona calisaya TaxID=153742 RepID=A0ABD2ZQS7_9GENT